MSSTRITLQNPSVIPQDEHVPQQVNLEIISLNDETNDLSSSMQVIPQDEIYIVQNQLLEEYFGDSESENNYSEENLTNGYDNQMSIHEYFGESESENEFELEQKPNLNLTSNHMSPDPELYFSDSSSEFISEKVKLEEFSENPLPITDWGICISSEQKECCICFETKQVFTPSCCGEKQDICLDCIWNVIKQKVPKRQQLDKKIIEKYLLSNFSCCFCREKTKINIHIPSMFPCLFSTFCKSILNIQKPKKKRGRPPIKKSRRGRPRTS